MDSEPSHVEYTTSLILTFHTGENCDFQAYDDFMTTSGLEYVPTETKPQQFVYRITNIKKFQAARLKHGI